MNKEILRLSIPSILANITVPIVGIVDVAIAGHIANASAIGGIAIGSMLFDLLYWNFGFLRVGTGGMTAQAFGRKDHQGMMDILTQSLSMALMGALFVFAIGWPFVNLVMFCVPCSPEVELFARQYFWIRIWAAPATLSLMAFKGWFIGTQNTVNPMICDIVVNVVNMAASFYLAVYTPLGAIGVAYGTVIAQYTGLLTAITLLVLGYRGLFRYIGIRASIGWQKIRHLAALNGNLVLRSLGFMVVYVGFTALTSKYGDEALAVGTIMMKLFMVFSYFVDGFAYAGEALVGRFIGAQSRPEVVRAVRLLFCWTLAVGLIFTLLYLLQGEQMVCLMTSEVSVIEASRPFHFWLVLMPLVSCAAFMWDGVFIGATAGRQVRDCMLFAALGFVLAYAGLFRFIGIQAVYVGYFVHLLVRTLYLSIRWKKVLNRAFGYSESPTFRKGVGAVTLCLLCCLLPLQGRAQTDTIDYADIDTAFWGRIERLMGEELERQQQVQNVIDKYEDMLSRDERSLHLEGANYLLRGLLNLNKDRQFRRSLTQPMKRHDADVLDYGIAFSPLAVTWGLKAAGVQSRSTLKRMLIANAIALGLTAGLTEGIKGVSVQRPNWVDSNSMPSGHTAMAFASATILHREFGYISPWISVGGYTVATATQFLRVRRNEHWLADTYIGAGIGAISTHLAYFLTDLILGEEGIHRPKLQVRDILRTINFIERPTSLSLVSGFDMGHEGKVNSSSMYSAGLVYSHFFDPHWGMEAQGRVATCDLNLNGTNSNLDVYHLDLGAVWSHPLNASSRFAIRGFGGMRFIDNSLLQLRREFRPEFGVGISSDLMRSPTNIMGIGFDYTHTFSDWFTDRWFFTLQYKIQL